MDGTTTEVRIYPQDIFERESMLESFDSVCVGHIACVHKIRDLSADHLAHLLAMKKRVKIELPVVYQTHWAWLFQRLEEWLCHPVGLVVNDWGVLYELAQLGVSRDVPIGLGRALVYSYATCPWFEGILAAEEPEVQKAWRDLNVDSEEMLAWLAEMSVRELDIDLHPTLRTSVARLRGAGFRVNGFVGYPLAAVSRSCHAVRNLGAEVGQCQHLCDLPVRLEPRQRWNRFDDTWMRISKETRERLGRLLVYGTVVVHETDQPSLAGISVDTVCLDLRFSPTRLARGYDSKVMVTE